MMQKNSKLKETIRENIYPFLLLVATISLSSIALSIIPISNGARLKNSCITSAKKSLKYKNPETKEYGINLDELASIEGYRFCLQSQ